jgi:N-acylneuraminate cytidylyltransferase
LKSLIIIPARGGSKGIPRKNIKLLDGKPLIQYTIEAAREVLGDEFICVSTDDEEIKTTVENIGLSLPFLRPKELATDTSSSEDVLKHAIQFYKGLGKKFDKIILLQPTSPFRTGNQIKEALSIYSNDLDMVVSVKETKSNPYYVLCEEDEEGWLVKSKNGAFTRRQDCPIVYELNGAIYIINVNSLETKGMNNFNRTLKYVMDQKSSLDIDEEIDWLMAELLIKE